MGGCPLGFDLLPSNWSQSSSFPVRRVIFAEDNLKKMDVPTLVLHGEDDQIVPVKNSAKKSAKLIRGAKEIYYPGAPHGLTATHQDKVNFDLLAFIKS
jgi:non-heme chloroperoxidase